MNAVPGTIAAYWRSCAPYQNVPVVSPCNPRHAYVHFPCCARNTASHIGEVSNAAHIYLSLEVVKSSKTVRPT